MSDPVVRELMLAVEFMRFACEHARGRSLEDQQRLDSAIRVGINVNRKHASLIEDYQNDTYWLDVNKLARRIIGWKEEQP
jgi:hypothetical protein